MTLNIEDLKDNREDILKAEICSYFSLFDKLKLDNRNRRIQILNFPSITDNCSPLKDNIKAKLNIGNYSINIYWYSENLDNLICWRWSSSIYRKDCERINSWIDKWNPDSININYNDFWLNNAYWYNHVEFYIQKVIEKRENLINHLSNINDLLKKYNTDLCIKWNIRSLLKLLPSDSRLPVADVSLWDQTYMSVCLYKARLAEIVLMQWKDKSWNQVADYWRTRWKRSIMWVIYDKLALKEKATKLWLLKWYDDLIIELDQSVKNYIETEIVLWNEIYNDETWIYFLVPECCKWVQI